MIFVSGPLNKHLKKRGVQVFHWVLNTTEDFEYSISVSII